MDRERLDQWLERGILALLLGILIFGPLALGAVRPLEFLVIQTATIACIGLWIARLWIGGGHRLYWPPACWAVLGFALYAVARYFTAEIEYVARQELMRVLVYAALFFVALNNVTRKETFTLVAWTMVVLAAGISIYALMQWGTNSNQVWHFQRPAGYSHRGSGTYINPNHLAGFLEMILPLSLGYALMGRSGHLIKIGLGYASLVIAAGIAVSISRAGWAAALIAVLFLTAFQIRHRNFRLPALGFALLIALGALVFFAKSYVAQRRAGHTLDMRKEASGGVRYRIWQGAFAMWKETPASMWFGVGPAHFDYRFPQFRPDDLQSRPQWVHNDYVEALTEWGVIGFGLILTFLVLMTAGVARAWKYARRGVSDLVTRAEERGAHLSDRAAFVLGVSLGLVALLFHSFFDFNMHIPANAILAVVLMALLAGHLRFATERHWVRSRVPTQAAITAVGGALMVVLAIQSGRGAGEQYWLRRAETSGKPVTERVQDLVRAHRIEPANFDTAHKIGEEFRLESWGGAEGHEDLARKAADWFRTAIAANPYDIHSQLRLGMSLDWIGQHQEATAAFDAAMRMAPNSYYAMAIQGWHQFQLGNLPLARKYLERSRELTPWGHANPVAISYLELIQARESEPASPLWKR